MKLIPEIKSAWKMFSIQAQTLALAILGAWTTIPPELKSNLPPDLVYWMAMGLMVAGIVGRLIDQPSITKAE